MLKPEDVIPAVLTGGMYRSEDKVAPKFKLGDKVLVRNHQPRGHTRLPGYLRGKEGVIAIDHGVFVFPDTLAHGEGEKPQHCYTVQFDSKAVWGTKGVAGDTLRVDLFDDYMDLVKK